MPRKRLGAIQDIPPTTDPATKRWMNSVKEALDVRLGRRGDPGEAAVTFNDLVDSGVVQGTGRVDPRTGLPELADRPDPGGGETEYGTPPRPSGVVAEGVFGGVHLLWDHPNNRPDITFTEVRRNDAPDLETAETVGGVNGASYFDIMTAEAAQTWYYWIRHASNNGRVGPWSLMVEATKPANTDFVLEQLSEALSEQEFTDVLNDRIDLIDGDEQMNGSVNARIAEERIEREDEDSALAQQVNTVQSNLDDDIVSVQQTLTADIEEVEDDVFELGAQYTLVLDADGYVVGYTVYNDGTTSSMVFRIDQLAIGEPGGGTYYPFYFDTNDNTAYLDTARIQDASIDEGKLGPVTFGKIVDSNGNPVTTVAGKLRAQHIQTNQLNVNSAARFTGDVFSDNFQSGQSGWAILQNGYVEFNEAMIRGNLEVQSITVNDEAPFGALRFEVNELNIDRSNCGGWSEDRTDSFNIARQDTVNINEMPENSYFNLSLHLSDIYVYAGPPNPRSSCTVYPGGNPDLPSETGYTEWVTVGSASVRFRVWVDGSRQYNNYKSVSVSSNQASYNHKELRIDFGNADDVLSYTYPSYSANSTVQVRVDISLDAEMLTLYAQCSAYRCLGSEAFIPSLIASGDLFRLGTG